MADNVYSSAKILTKNEEVQKYELGNFINSEKIQYFYKKATPKDISDDGKKTK